MPLFFYWYILMRRPDSSFHPLIIIEVRNKIKKITPQKTNAPTQK